jgi:tRNA threonylcarbamoyladenosine biosynthesis protein TsaB
MKILSFDASGPTASVALREDERIVAMSYADCGLKHSVILLPMVEETMRRVGWTLRGLDLIAVTNGPGSFTGLRIAVATAKGLAFAHNTPCAGVSALEAMAWRSAECDGMVCAMMDARRGEFYTAAFDIIGGIPRRLTEDRALPLEAIETELAAYRRPVTRINDGAHPIPLAYGAAMAARGQTPADAAALVPFYLRQPQAERLIQKELP